MCLKPDVPRQMWLKHSYLLVHKLLEGGKTDIQVYRKLSCIRLISEENETGKKEIARVIRV